MILGIMLFFSFVIAPVVFTTLDEDNAQIVYAKEEYFLFIIMLI